MAYRPTAGSDIDSYYSSYPSYQHPSPSPNPGPIATNDNYSYQNPSHYYPEHTPNNVPNNNYQVYEQDNSGWDTKSTKSYQTYQSHYAESQVHLNPSAHHEMVEVAPPLPTLPYSQRPNYPPQQQIRPPFLREQSSAGWSVAKDQLMKRRSVRQVELYQGNLVLDVAVPSHIIPKGSERNEEMSKMRYTAATCDPDDFMRSKYSLRPYLYGRRTELFIVMTMYNEDEILFLKTMNAYGDLPFFSYYILIYLFVTVSSKISPTCVVGRVPRLGVIMAGRKLLYVSCLTAATRSIDVLFTF